MRAFILLACLTLVACSSDHETNSAGTTIGHVQCPPNKEPCPVQNDPR